MAFPGPPEQTIEDPSDRARESNINVEGARIRFPDIPIAFNMSYNPSLNSPVFNYQNNPTYFDLQVPYMQMQMQETYQILASFLGSGITTSVTVITGVSLVTGYLRFATTTLNFTDGVITSTAAGSNIDIATATCP
jgi:hypothetical protein